MKLVRARNDRILRWCPIFDLSVCVNLKQDHTVQRRSCRRVPGGARLHDYWQQASKRGAAKEVRFPGFRPDGDEERRADHGGERDEAQVVREEGGGGRERGERSVSREAPETTEILSSLRLEESTEREAQSDKSYYK